MTACFSWDPDLLDNIHINSFCLFVFCFFNIFIDYAITVVLFPPFTQLHPAQPVPPTFPPYSLCPWVILISSLAFTFPTLFLPSPVYFPPIIYATYSLYLSPLSPPPNPLLITLHFCGSVPVLVVCLVCFCFCFRCGC